MPVFATLVAAAINGLTSFYALALTYAEAIKWARRTFIILLGASFITAVSVCVNTIFGMIAAIPTSAPWMGRFVMGVGMFIPSNAGAVLACLGAVWLACVVYRLKLEGLRW